MPSRSPLLHLAAAGLLALAVSACSRTSAESLYEPAPPPRRAADAKTQLEYGNPPPPRAPRY